MVTRWAGAASRALLMALLVATPPLILGGPPGSAPLVALFALIAAAFTWSEYAATAPSLVEFRDAPPFNRLRFGLLALTVTVSCLVLREDGGDTAVLLLRTLGRRLGESLDFPYSPVRLLVLTLPQDAAPQLHAALRTVAALSYAGALAAVLLFAGLARLGAWPGDGFPGGFNVWVNLPQFDPAAGGDVVERLGRDAAFNLSLGICLPFLVPMGLDLMGAPVGRVLGGDPATLVWAVAAWAFLPASLVMRGVALARVAALIAAQRARATADAAALQAA